MQAIQQIKYKDPLVIDATFLAFIKKSLGLITTQVKPSVTIDKAFDSIGNEVGKYEGLTRAFRYCRTNCAITSGDILSFLVIASSSSDDTLEYALDVDYKNVIPWQRDNKLSLQILEEYVSKFCQVRIKVRVADKKNDEIGERNTIIFSYLVRSKDFNPLEK
jgi:hypothetical protein